MEKLKKLNYKGSENNDIFPSFALPIIKTKNILLSQSSVIEQYLAELLGFLPKNINDKYKVLTIRDTIKDASTEAFKKENEKDISDDDKKEFYEKRFKSFIDLFDKQLKMNKNGKEWLIGNNITLADVQLFQFLRSFEKANDKYYKEICSDELKEFKNRFEKIENISKFIASDECPPCQPKFLG